MRRAISSRSSGFGKLGLSHTYARRTVLENLRNLPHAPGVQMQSVPGRPLGKELRMRDGDLSDPEDEVEARIKSEPISRIRLRNDYD